LLLLGAAGQRAREEQAGSPAAAVARKRRSAMREKPILRVMVKRFFPFVLLFALYVQVHGDFGPGGGFQAGVVFAVGFLLFALIFGLEPLNDRLPPRVVQVGMALGLLTYGGTGVVALLRGGAFLDYNALAHDAVHGQHLGIFAVELGVGITVASVMVSLFVSVAGRRSPS
jgi:multicomponent Na+:H+ antiporter subunit B